MTLAPAGSEYSPFWVRLVRAPLWPYLAHAPWFRTTLLVTSTLVAPAFLATGLFRAGIPDPGIVLACVAVAAALYRFARPRWLAWTWLAGCAAYAVLLYWILWQMATDLSGLS